MRDAAFADLKEALEGALAFERGEHIELSVTRIQASPAPESLSRQSRLACDISATMHGLGDDDDLAHNIVELSETE
jgi:hypothetical protein